MIMRQEKLSMIVPPSGIEPELPASEADALSVTPRGQAGIACSW